MDAPNLEQFIHVGKIPKAGENIIEKSVSALPKQMVSGFHGVGTVSPESDRNADLGGEHPNGGPNDGQQLGSIAGAVSVEFRYLLIESGAS